MAVAALSKETLYMLTPRTFAIVIAVGAAASAPLAALAAGPYHPAPTEAGVTYHPEHASSDKSRSQVLAELDTAMGNPAWKNVSRGAPWPAAPVSAGKTRAEVQQELREAMRHPAWPSASRGVPWPAEK